MVFVVLLGDELRLRSQLLFELLNGELQSSNLLFHLGETFVGTARN